MKTNYNTVMEEIINNLKSKPKLLLHACCGVCSSAVIERLNDIFDITILFYNPNIYPEKEYQKRLETQRKIINKLNKNIKLLEIGYNKEDFEKIAQGLEKEKEGGKRCIKCYHLRLEKTAKIAKEKNYDYFCTTLSISPYKHSSTLNNLGKALENKYKIKYLYSDFKKKNGYKRSVELAKKYNLYRQTYCGCKYAKIQMEKENN